jgi:cell shape-determining protein MreD
VKRAFALFVLGSLAMMVQGAAATALPPSWCPDVGFLLVVAIGLTWRSAAGGLVLAALLGYVADLLSGTLLGQHTLLRILAFVAARGGSLHFNLRGPLPQAVFVALLTVANAVALGALTAFFSVGPGLAPAPGGVLVAHAVANAACAPVVTLVTGRLVGLLGNEESTRRLRLESGRWTA